MIAQAWSEATAQPMGGPVSFAQHFKATFTRKCVVKVRMQHLHGAYREPGLFLRPSAAP